jgi:hypothetical protein
MRARRSAWDSSSSAERGTVRSACQCDSPISGSGSDMVTASGQARHACGWCSKYAGSGGHPGCGITGAPQHRQRHSSSGLRSASSARIICVFPDACSTCANVARNPCFTKIPILVIPVQQYWAERWDASLPCVGRLRVDPAAWLTCDTGSVHLSLFTHRPFPSNREKQ